ncbi:MAG: hypothetical protein Unbinned4052contig1001_3 [Prokaryotic dsDNA virus sp.]|nr:MAG: hypothetical protein Unbinned4052contig1001_3 [Prokaryotic dsDNA virus sp.]|tara:strand:+ start:431 stop:646 length:216 start_codon:yes stop_codon:yes gene_type:complete
MAKYRNETLGVVNVGGAVIAPKKVADLDDKARGLAGLVKRGILVKVDGRSAGAKTDKPADKAEQPQQKAAE